MQILWILLLLPIFRKIWSEGTKKYTVMYMNIRKYLKVYAKFLHTSLASELEYKTNILIDLITAILSLIGSIFYYLFSSKIIEVLEAGNLKRHL